MPPYRTAIVPPLLEKTAGQYQYSPGLIAGGLLFVAGQVGRDETGTPITDPEEQYVAAFRGLGVILEEAGATYSSVVDMTTYHTSFDDFALFAEVKSRFFTEPPYPAWTGIEVTALALPGLRVEVKCIADLKG